MLFSLTPFSPHLSHTQGGHEDTRDPAEVMRLLREPRLPIPHPKQPPLGLCVSFIFIALVYTKTNNQKHKAIIIKLSAGTSPGPHTHVQKLGEAVETGRGRESPSPHQRGQPRALLRVSGAGIWVGRGGEGAPWGGDQNQLSIQQREAGRVLERGTHSPYLCPISPDGP